VPHTGLFDSFYRDLIFDSLAMFFKKMGVLPALLFVCHEHFVSPAPSAVIP
jgi:hypothetical protein